MLTESGILRILSFVFSFGPQPVNFLTMTCAGSPVRRLSTASSVTKSPHFILTTEWRWYWLDDQGGWNEYGLEVSEGAWASQCHLPLQYFSPFNRD